MAIPALARGPAEGLVAVAIAVPVFACVLLGARWLGGFAMAAFGVEPDGTVRVISGPRAIVEAQGALDDPSRWLRREVIKGLLLLIPIVGVPTAASVLLDTPLPMMAFCVVFGLVLLSGSRHLLLAGVWRARTGGELLASVTPALSALAVPETPEPAARRGTPRSPQMPRCFARTSSMRP